MKFRVIEQEAAPAAMPQRFRVVEQPDGRTEAQRAYDALPWYAQAAQAADDTARFIANGLTLGAMDRFAGYMGGEGFDAERAKSAQAVERAGLAGVAAEGVGMLLPAGALARSALSASRLVPAGLTGAKGLAARTGALALDGSTIGAVQALNKGENVQEGVATGFIGGALGNLGGEAIGAGISKAAGAFNKPIKPMTADELKAAGSRAFQEAENAGVVYRPEAVDRLRQTVYDDFAEFGFHPENHRGAAVAYDELARLAKGGNVSLKGIDAARRIAQGGYKPDVPSNNALIGKAIERIDEFMANATPNDVLLGNSQSATAALSRARDMWSRFRKLEKVEELLARAQNRAGSTGSGGNVENATRQELRKILDNKKLMRGFTPDEISAIRTAVLGTGTQNTLRLLGKLSPQGSGLMAALGLGGVASMPAVAIPALLGGAVAKRGAEAMTARNAETVKRLIAAGGKRAAITPAPNAVQRLADQYRPLLGRALLSGSLAAGSQ